MGSFANRLKSNENRTFVGQQRDGTGLAPSSQYGLITALEMTKRREDMGMQRTILIAVKGPNQIEKIIPPLKSAVKAGTRIVFLVRSHASGIQLSFLRDVDVLQPGVSVALAARCLRLGARAELAEQQISAARAALSRQGIGVTADFYTGCVGTAIRKHRAREDVHLIMKAKGVVPGVLQFLNWFIRHDRFSKPRQAPPALIVRSGLAAWR